MKNIALLIALVLALSLPAAALPANPTNTTSSSAITAAADRVTVASSTGITAAAGQVINTLFVIDDEVMAVQSLASGTTWNVTRGYRGTTAFTHASGAIVLALSPAQLYDNFLRGSCVSSAQVIVPRVVVSTGFRGTKAVYYEVCSGPLAAQIWTEATPLGDTAATTALSQYCNVMPGNVAYGSVGTSTAMVSGTEYLTSFYVPRTTKFTGIKVLLNATVGTDKVIAILRDSIGTQLATSATAGTTTSGADAYLALAFTSPFIIPGPARYWVGIQGGTTATDGLRLMAASTFVDVLATSATGTFGTITAGFTVPTTFTATKAPFVCTYN